MERPEFDITITNTGMVKVEVKGVKGRRCVELADLIREIVGREDERRLLPEFYEQEGAVRIFTKVRDSSGQ